MRHFRGVSREAIAAIFAAGAEVVAEAGGTVAGGHTIRNPEPIYGLAVQGVVHPDRVLRKSGAQPGDVVVLSKPLGTGLSLAAGSADEQAAAIAGMRTVNRRASELLVARGPRCMLSPTSPVTASQDMVGRLLNAPVFVLSSTRVACRCIPVFSELQKTVFERAEIRNREYVAGHLETSSDDALAAVCFDPQTSGGLLAAVEPDLASDLMNDGFWRVGEVEAGAAGIVLA